MIARPDETALRVEPGQFYLQQLELRRAAAERWSLLEKCASLARLATVTGGLVLAWLAVQERLISLGWVALPVVVFFALVVVHDRVIRRRDRYRSSVSFYEAGLARLEERWSGTGESGEVYRDPRHLYCDDLDLFGEGSLFELLCTARTRAGQDVLAAWLRRPATVQEIQARQEALRELRPRVDLREDLSLLAGALRAELSPQALISWVHATPGWSAKWARPVLGLAAGMNLLAAVGWAFLDWGPRLLLCLLLLETIAAIPLRPRISVMLANLEPAGRDLGVLRDMLRRIEEERFNSPRLVAMTEDLYSGGMPPSKRVRQLQTLVELLDSRRNLFFAPLALLLLWTPQIALAVEAWRRQWGPVLPRWLQLVGEIEALAALSGYAYEHPEDPFPEMEGSESGPVFEGEGLGHPLLPERRCVPNDLRLDRERRAWIVSGSNMSGKSTLLRTVGVNVVLALAGAPVRARRLRLSPLAVGASMRILDSLQEGSSRFFAEITRLRRILELTEGPLPVLFLLDEILHGTNSHDRRIGAAAVVRALLSRGAVGLVTTHDLALADIGEDASLAVGNVHFEDRIEGGRIVFDYRLRPGVVRKSNALALMREVGLEV